MATMNAAVVMSFDEPPHYQQFEVPQPQSNDEMLVDVLAIGVHPRTRTGAAGTHYTSSGTLPMIPGIDAVAQRPDGKRIYFVADDDVIGTMADKAVVDMRRAIELPDDVDVAKVAAAMNPAMSSWVALRRRVPIQSGQSVLVLGATGNAGAMAYRSPSGLAPGGWSVSAATAIVSTLSPLSAPMTPSSSPAMKTRQPVRSPRPPPRSTSSSTTCGASPHSRR
jgi:hypothetical protein